MKDLQRQVARMLFDPSPTALEGMSERGQRVYRRQVRRGLMSGVKLAIPIAIELLGRRRVDELLARWLAESPATTRLYWQLPLEFCQWFMEEPDPDHPALRELIHWETIEVDILNAEDPPEGLSLSSEPTEASSVVLDPSSRLCIYTHPVHLMDTASTGWPEPLPGPIFLLAYRRQERLRWTVVSPQVAQLLAAVIETQGSIAQGLSFLEGMYAEVDRASLLSELRSLTSAGALMGFD